MLFIDILILFSEMNNQRQSVTRNTEKLRCESLGKFISYFSPFLSHAIIFYPIGYCFLLANFSFPSRFFSLVTEVSILAFICLTFCSSISTCDIQRAWTASLLTKCWLHLPIGRMKMIRKRQRVTTILHHNTIIVLHHFHPSLQLIYQHRSMKIRNLTIRIRSIILTHSHQIISTMMIYRITVVLLLDIIRQPIITNGIILLKNKFKILFIRRNHLIKLSYQFMIIIHHRLMEITRCFIDKWVAWNHLQWNLQ